MIEAYWNEVFGEYKTQTGKFEIPGMPEPLMSAHFGVSNVIGATYKLASQSFTLCVFPPKKHQLKSFIQKQSLYLAIESQNFWVTQQQLNPQAVGFIQKLLPFLAGLSTPHYHFFLESHGEILATAIVGEAECGCFLFNLVVNEKYRKQGLGLQMLRVIQNEFSTKPTFYWTKHAWFTLDAETTALSLVSEGALER
jgi:ribosomal protein S18 acetylase RimI-like enzyme